MMSNEKGSMNFTHRHLHLFKLKTNDLCLLSHVFCQLKRNNYYHCSLFISKQKEKYIDSFTYREINRLFGLLFVIKHSIRGNTTHYTLHTIAKWMRLFFLLFFYRILFVSSLKRCFFNLDPDSFRLQTEKFATRSSKFKW